MSALPHSTEPHTTLQYLSALRPQMGGRKGRRARREANEAYLCCIAIVPDPHEFCVCGLVR